tara:strand:- start:494 stop:901 length:408 start_codon:yes stop_codon:yes gene_type:complete
MSEFKISYKGELRTEVEHVDSSMKILTDAPKDNQGLGRTFSPTDLVASSLASCMITIIAIAKRTHKLQIDKMNAKVTKIMSHSFPRRISAIKLNLNINGDLDAKSKTIIERSAHTCPVHNSLHPDIKIKLTFTYN